MVAEGAAGALAGAWQQNPACKYIRQWIDDLRSDMYVAVALDRFIQLVDGYLETAAQERNVETVKITKEDVYACLKYDDTVKIVDVDGREVLWLWGGWRLHDLMRRVAEVAAKEGEVSAVAGI
jgi:hypothetical protein